MPKHNLNSLSLTYTRAKQYAATHRDDAAIAAFFVALLLALLIIP